MRHKHVGPIDRVCHGCFDEVNAEDRDQERRKLIAGIALLVGLVISGLVLLSWYLTKRGSHLW